MAAVSVVLAFLFAAPAAGVVMETAMCPEGDNASACDWPGDFIITRLWKDADASDGYTTQDVADEFEDGFAPLVASEPGFKAYVGAPSTSQDDLVFFFNIFQTEDESLNAQAEAVAFKEEGVLNDKIVPELFAAGQISFVTATDSLCELSPDGKPPTGFLGITAYTEGSMALEELVANAEAGLGPRLEEEEGFEMYLGAVTESSDGDGIAIFMRAFETEEELDVALTATSDWVAGTGEFEGLDGPAGGGPDVFDGNLIHSEKYEISFKILCSDGMVPTSFSYSYSMSM